VQKGLQPDLTLLLDAPLEVGASRIGSRMPDHFEREQRPFFERVRSAYLSLAAQHPERIKIVDAALPLPEVQRRIKAEIAALVGRWTAVNR
jgi:dTMP kinase